MKTETNKADRIADLTARIAVSEKWIAENTGKLHHSFIIKEREAQQGPRAELAALLAT